MVDRGSAVADGDRTYDPDIENSVFAKYGGRDCLVAHGPHRGGWAVPTLLTPGHIRKHGAVTRELLFCQTRTVNVRADVMTTGRHDALIEEITSRLSMEPGVRAIRWETRD